MQVGGGWLVWQTIRENKGWWMAVLGSLVLVGYGFIPTLQPTDSFGRIYGAYLCCCWWCSCAHIASMLNFNSCIRGLLCSIQLCVGVDH